ncbi:MAG: COX15/CtaA family protein, partial [Planctomycetota bacterium]
VDEPAVSLIMPLSTMEEPRVYLEHTHRLFGSLVGLTTLTWLGLAIWRRAGRAPITIAAVVFGLVCVQGLLGAFRVAENSPWIAALHGVFGQLVFATAVFGAARFSPLWSDDDHGETSWPEATRRAGGRAAFLAALALGALAFQLLTGSMSRHLASGHAAITHVVFAFGAAMLVTLAGATMLSAERFSRIGTVLRQLGRGMIAVVVIQVALGLFALVAVGGGDAVRPIPLESELGQAHAIEVGEALVTTAHQSNGALLLALATLSVAWTRHAARD